MMCLPLNCGNSRFVSWHLLCGSVMIFAKGGLRMDQQKIGKFLKYLRKDKGLTQEQLAEHFCVSSRTVSRWENGNNMPDVDILIGLADFYEVDFRELIDGERKNENMDKETKETVLKAAEYMNAGGRVHECGNRAIYEACTLTFTGRGNLLVCGKFD